MALFRTVGRALPVPHYLLIATTEVPPPSPSPGPTDKESFRRVFRSPGREARSHGPPKPLELAIINAVVTRLSRLTPSEPCRAPSPPSPPHIGPAGCAINHHLRCRSAFLPALWPVLRSTRKLVGWLGWLRVALFAPILGVAVACQWRL